MAGEDQFEPAADADAVDAGDDGDGQALDAVEKRQHKAQALDHLAFRLEAVELVDVGADDEVALLAGQQDESAHGAGACAFLDLRDDRSQLLEGPCAESVRARAFAIEDRPGDPLLVDREAPVVQVHGPRVGASRIFEIVSHLFGLQYLLCRSAAKRA